MTLSEILHKEGREEGIRIGIEKGIAIGLDKGELIGEIRVFQQVAGWRRASKKELRGKPVAYLKKLLAQVRKECLARVRVRGNVGAPR